MFSLGTFSSAVLLEEFVLGVGTALKTVTNLDLQLENTSDSSVDKLVLFQALDLLGDQFPSLKFLHSQGYMNEAFMHTLGKKCPLLSAMSIVPGQDELLCIQQFLLLQPLLFPLLHSVSFPSLNVLPDMSLNSSIISVNIGCLRLSSGDYNNMPPKLHNLSLVSLGYHEGPLVGISPTLSSLQSLDIKWDTDMQLHTIAEMLRSAPALHVIRLVPDHGQFLKVNCWSDTNPTSTIIADLSVLRARVGIDVIRDAGFYFCLEDMKAVVSVPVFLASLPLMKGFTRLELALGDRDVLAIFLNAFPDVQKLGLIGVNGVDDLALQALVACSCMTTLNFFGCEEFTTAGLLHLCMRLPRLVCVTCEEVSHHLGKAALEKCEKLLERRGLHVSISNFKTEDYEWITNQPRQGDLQSSISRFKVMLLESGK